jgi:hypothetical protein
LVSLIEAALIRYRQERQPAFLKQQLGWAGGLLVGLMICSYGLRQLRRWLRHHQPQFSAASDQPVTTALQHTVYSRERRFYQELSRWGYWLGQFILWFGGLWGLLGLFPYARTWQQPLLMLARVPVRILLVVVLGYGAGRPGVRY